MRTRSPQFAAMLALAATLFAADLRPPDPVSRLANVSLFAYGGVGFAGVVSDGEKAYLAILSRPSAEADFLTVLSIGTPQAKAYALVAIHKLNPDRFKAFADQFRASTESVHTARGCIFATETLGSIVQKIDKNGY